MPVGEDDGLDGVQPVPDPVEVGEDQVDPGLVVLGEQHPAVHDEQPADGHLDAELFGDLADRALSRRLVRFDDAARQFPVGLEPGFAEQHPADRIPQQHMRDKALLRKC